MSENAGIDPRVAAAEESTEEQDELDATQIAEDPTQEAPRLEDQLDA